MKQLVSVLLFLWVLPGCSKPPPTDAAEGDLASRRVAHPTSPSPEDSLRKELEENYTKIVDGFKNNDPSVWEGFLAPGFQLKLFNGQIQDRQWVSNYVRNNAKTFKVVSLSMRIQSLTIEGNDAIAIVEQKSSRTFKDKEGQPHQLDVGAVQREVWTKTLDGLRLRFVEEKEVLYVKEDGKPKGP
jgi:hypothetical protein